MVDVGVMANWDSYDDRTICTCYSFAYSPKAFSDSAVPEQRIRDRDLCSRNIVEVVILDIEFDANDAVLLTATLRFEGKTLNWESRWKISAEIDVVVPLGFH